MDPVSPRTLKKKVDFALLHPAGDDSPPPAMLLAPAQATGKVQHPWPRSWDQILDSHQVGQ